MSDSRNISRDTLVLLLASALTVQVWAHGGEDHGDEKKSTPAPVAVAAVNAVNAQGQVTFIEPAVRLPDGSIFVPKSAQRQLALRTQAARKGEFPRTVELNGRVVADPNAGGRVQTFQSGRIEAGPKGLAVLGQRVSKGQLLAWLQPASSAIERGSQQSALAELAAQESVLGRRVARLRQLEGSVPEKDIEQAQIELAAFKKRKAAIGGSLGREALVAPVSGVVSAANAVVGQVVDAREVVFEVIDPQRLAVEALAYDPQLLAGLARASAAVAGGVLDLSFVGIGRTLKDLAMPVLFRVELPKTGELPALAVGQTLKVLAQTSERQPGVAVPAGAVVRNAANESVVWVHESAERFVSRKVRIAPLDGRTVAVTDGLGGGERVVVHGAASLSQIR
ncbi:Efflux transporter, RND family, MFP subunit [Candidatus Accumulibacter aalborgensis]|uniref:Efflux transporter, RND family, MFP subunit n=1 Tax=Candidatus Accumulibacter aalborgensis TaxID=1860102 RepID=A0A1A8XXX6_9PROT|nr:Efflux transporter, RND family, MFP subunit [Candidatus Accumulibacter aalborgensis]